MLPASLALTAMNGSIFIGGSGQLYPSATGNLTLLADESITLVNTQYSDIANAAWLGLINAPASSLPSPTNPIGGDQGWNFLQTAGGFFNSRFTLNDPGLHTSDTEPAQIYSLNGDIFDGQIITNGSGGFYTNPIMLVLPKPASIQAGRDIFNLSFLGQNLDDSDVTRIVAGRDIYDPPLPSFIVRPANIPIPVLQLGGPGRFDIEAGRDIGPLAGNQPTTGIQAVGDLYNAYLPYQSASISVLFGTGPGVNWDGFANAYINPAASVVGVPSFAPDLVDYVHQYQSDQNKKQGGSGSVAALTPDQAWRYSRHCRWRSSRR
jgi:hypothetical protein